MVLRFAKEKKQPRYYQWDYPAGWPPMYYLTAKALDAYGYKADAVRITSKYLDVVTKNYIAPKPKEFERRKQGELITSQRKTGLVFEKYNVVSGEINDTEYAARAFHGWSYGIFIWSLEYIRGFQHAESPYNAQTMTHGT